MVGNVEEIKLCTSLKLRLFTSPFRRVNRAPVKILSLLCFLDECCKPFLPVQVRQLVLWKRIGQIPLKASQYTLIHRLEQFNVPNDSHRRSQKSFALILIICYTT